MNLKKLALGILLAFALGAMPAVAQDTAIGTQGSAAKTDKQEAKSTAKKAGNKGSETTKSVADRLGGKKNKLDINSASRSELEVLAGMDATSAQKVIDGRPYRAKNELVTKKILPQSTYDQIKDEIIAKHPAGAKAGKKTDKSDATTTKTEKKGDKTKP